MNRNVNSSKCSCITIEELCMADGTLPNKKVYALHSISRDPNCIDLWKQCSFCQQKKTIGRHSASMLFKSGVDYKMLDAIKNVVKDWPEKDKHCSVSWDEVSVDEHLDYNTSQDCIEGFVELAGARKPSFATHSLTFMARGINISFKQTFGYFFTSSLFAIELVELVKLMIGALSTTG